MTSKSTTVELSFWIAPDDLLPEAQVAAFIGKDPEALSDIQSQLGSLTVTSGETSMRFADTLFWMVPQLCFDVVVNLVETGTAFFDPWSAENGYEFKRAGGSIDISSTYGQPCSFPDASYLSAMFETGLRYVALVERYWREQAGEDFPVLKERAENARKALENL